MELHYDEATKNRLRAWRANDAPLYSATEEQLGRILAAPESYGLNGTPFVPRLVSFAVHGRDEEYVITWEVAHDAIIIGDVCSVTDMRQRQHLRED
jgi:hypothetical protein